MSNWLIDWFLRILYQLLRYIPRRQQSRVVTYLLNTSGTMLRKTRFICTRKLHISNTGFVLSFFLFYQSFHISTNICLPLASRSKFYIIFQIIKIKITGFWDFSCSLVHKHDISGNLLSSPSYFTWSLIREAEGSRETLSPTFHNRECYNLSQKWQQWEPQVTYSGPVLRKLLVTITTTSSKKIFLFVQIGLILWERCRETVMPKAYIFI